MKRILLVKTSSMGDVVHNLTTVSDIRRKLPNTEIDWLVEKSFAAIPTMHPEVSQVIPVELRRWRRQLLHSETWNQIRQIRQRLHERDYDAVVDTQGLIKSAIIAGWGGKPVSGYDRSSIREPLASLFYRNRFQVSRQQHAVDRNRQLVAAALEYDLRDLPLDYGMTARTEDVVAGLGRNYVVCLHGTSRESKLWPEENWQQLLTTIGEAGVQPVLVWGAEQERMRSERLGHAVGSAVIAPRLSLEQLAALVAGSAGVIGVDTGPVHLAAALGCKTVALYTDTEPGKTGVVAANPSAVINLGATGEIPSPQQARDAMRRLGIL